MQHLSGKFLAVWILATLAACALAWWLGWRYRRALVGLMRAPLADAATRGSAAPLGDSAASPLNAATLPTREQWRRAEARVIVALVALSLLIALTRGVISHLLLVEEPFSVPRTLSLATIYAWPVLAALASMRRWSALRLACALALWFVAAIAFATWRTTEAQTLADTLKFLAWEMGPPALALLALNTRRLRAAAPWLWLPLALLVVATLLGMELLIWLFETRSPLLLWLASWTDSWLAIAAFPLGMLALAWWPVMRFARWLARAYTARRVSDLMVQFSAAWGLNLGFEATSSGPLMLLPLLWIALALLAAHALARRRAARPAAVPTLLVLRVFQQDANIGALFDDVVERWRSVGNTVLIAGTDLVDQTLDAGDLFDHLDGRLAARFVRHASDVPARLAAFDWTPDAEGRWRVNEGYCHDTAWQPALLALVERADVVLMDLRGFKAHNAGCRFELGVLARAAQVERVVVLTDAATDLATARADAAAAPRGRFAWIALPAGRLARGRVARRVRDALVRAAEPEFAVRAAASLP